MKKINEVFKEIESENNNKVKDTTVVIELKDFIEEHKNLIKVLRSGDKKAQEAEALRQELELEEETGESENDDESEEEVED